MNSIVSVASLAAAASVASPSIAAPQKTLDFKAALDRAESLVSCLRDGHVEDGFIPNEHSAERMLHYFRKEVEKEGSSTDEEFDAVVDFCNEHSQSLDWLFFGDPGVMICRAAKNSKRAMQVALELKKTAQRGRGPSQFDLYRLPFFDANSSSPCWAVAPTGKYAEDCDTGAAYAIAFLRSCDGTYGWGSLMASIVTSMISAGRAGPWHADGRKKNNGIVVGFMSAIGSALSCNNVRTDIADALERERAEFKAEIAELPHPRKRQRASRQQAAVA